MPPTDETRKPIRLGVLLSGGGTTLLNLLEKIRAGELAAEIAVVIASRPCRGAERARQAGLRTVVIPYRRQPDVETYSRKIAEALDEAGVDLVVQAGFLSLWRIPERYQGRVMNIHPALLPKFGGKGMYGHHVHQAVLAAGEAESGCTVHFATNEYDSGPIVLQRRVPVCAEDTPEQLARRVFEQECIAYPEAIRLFAEGRLRIEGDRVRILPPRP